MVSSLIAWSLRLLKMYNFTEIGSICSFQKRAIGQCLVGGKCKEFCFPGIHAFKVTSLGVPSIVLGLPFYCRESER